MLKREVIEGEKVKETQLQIKKILTKANKQAEKKASIEAMPSEPLIPATEAENTWID